MADSKEGSSDDNRIEDEEENNNGIPPTEDESVLPEAEAAARAYYAGTVFEVISIEVKSRTEEEIIFSVSVSRGGVIQEPDRSCTLQYSDGAWKVTNEGY